MTWLQIWNNLFLIFLNFILQCIHKPILRIPLILQCRHHILIHPTESNNVTYNNFFSLSLPMQPFACLLIMLKVKNTRADCPLNKGGGLSEKTILHHQRLISSILTSAVQCNYPASRVKPNSSALLIAEGTDVVTVSKRLGHSKASTTTDIYAHSLKKTDIEAANTK